MLSPAQLLFGAGAGSLVGFSLGLVGGGGSILAVPLLIYGVGLHDTHLAIGTSACAVALSALANLFGHARRGHVRWSAAALFSAIGVIGAWAGSTIGKATGERNLLIFFALALVAAAFSMLWRGEKTPTDETGARLSPRWRLAIAGGATGALAGFFGIGGGFLIVPALVAATGMPIIEAIGSSLMAVTAFGLTTAINYAISGWVDWPLAIAFVAGGIVGGMLGSRSALWLSRYRGALNLVFAAVLMSTAAYLIIRVLRG
ncbi:MAG TPA: sulfite exporter TauE/SafE family protein [Roseiarcus sp.]|jgi:hypothetical protein